MSMPALIESALAFWDEHGQGDAVREGFEAAPARPVTLRANTLKADRRDVDAALAGEGIAFDRVPWYADAYILDDELRERAVWGLPAYHAGEVYLQSLSSMLPPLALAPTPGSDVLDMCAAPGGKTSQMAALAEGRAHITACEMSAPRAEKLAYNLEKLGVRSVNIMRVDARRLDEFFSFDEILLDAPCTGTGTYRAGDERATSRMTEKLLAKTVRSQQALLDRALGALKPGGRLAYSTCSILPEENDEQVIRALKKHRDCELVPLAPRMVAAKADEDEAAPLAPSATAIVEAAAVGTIPRLPSTLPGTITVCPTRLFEGFYLALITKKRR